MGKSLLGKMISYWIFLAGGVFVTRVILGITAASTYIFMFVLLTVAYWAFAIYSERKKKND